jgi:hypothetical protein
VQGSAIDVDGIEDLPGASLSVDIEITEPHR